jgi:hypothetical protein
MRHKKGRISGLFYKFFLTLLGYPNQCKGRNRRDTQRNKKVLTTEPMTEKLSHHHRPVVTVSKYRRRHSSQPDTR